MKNKKFIQAWLELQELCSSVPICLECNKCKLLDFCSTCGPRLQVETGYYDKSAPYLCQLTKLRKKISDKHLNLE